MPLYGRKPKGLGTPLVESLTGFLARLCAARCLPVMDVLDQMVRPLVSEGTVYARGDLSWYLTSTVVRHDGAGTPARETALALERLTGCRDLLLHTCVPWAPVLREARAGMVRQRGKRWCAPCLAGWHAAGVEPWEPLLWRLAPAVRCPVHRVRLSERCPSCGRTLRLVTQRVLPGHCERCGRLLHIGDPALGADRKAVVRDADARWEWWTALALGQMLQHQRAVMERGSPRGFERLIEAVVERSEGGHGLVARRLGASYSSAVRWSRGEGRPRLGPFLRACMVSGTSPAHVALAGDEADVFAPALPCAWNARRGPGRAQAPVIRQKQGRALSRDRRRRIEATLERIIAEGGRRSMKAVEAEVGTTLGTLKLSFAQHYERLVVVIEAYRAAERDALRERVVRALDEEIGAPEPRSAFEVSRRLGVSPAMLRSHCPERYARLVALYAERRREATRRRREERARRVREATIELARAEGLAPSLWRCVLHSGLPGSVCGKAEVREAWRESLAQ